MQTLLFQNLHVCYTSTKILIEVDETVKTLVLKIPQIRLYKNERKASQKEK